MIDTPQSIGRYKTELRKSEQRRLELKKQYPEEWDEYVWDDDGDDGKPGTVLLGPLEFEMNPGWNICENLLHLIIEGSVYIGYQQGNVNLNLGIDEENESYVSNSMLNLGTISVF